MLRKLVRYLLIASFVCVLLSGMDRSALYAGPTGEGDDWPTYRSAQFGYEVKHPPSLTPVEKAVNPKGNPSSVPSDIWFGDQVHIITRIPALPVADVARYFADAKPVTLASGLDALLLERVSTPLGGGEALRSLEYLVRANDADYFLIFTPTDNSPSTSALEGSFHRMVTTFAVQPHGYIATDSKVAAQTDGFDFPVDPRDGSSGRAPSYASYNVKNPYLAGTSNCYGKAMTQLQHTAEDWFRDAGSNVYAIANGRVIWSANANYPGGVVIIEHTLPAGVTTPWGNNLIYSMYAHLDTGSLISQWSDVTKGQVVGRVLYQVNNNHLHWEVRRYGDMHGAPGTVNGHPFCNNSWPGPGYTDTDADPGWWGYTNPSGWVDGHRSGGGGGNPNGPPGYAFCVWEGSRCNFSGTKDVAYGLNGSFNYRTNITGGIDCNNDQFGDPLSGTRKACFIKDAAVQRPSPPSLQSPGDGSTINEGQGITLAWSATGSEHYGEIWGGPSGTLTFGWQGGATKDIGAQWAGYTYSWHAKARNSAGESDWSNTWSFTVKLAAPSNLNASAVSTSQINLTWSDNSGNEEGYEILRNGASIARLGAGATSYQNTGLSCATSYSYQVRAYRGSIVSDMSNTASASTAACPPGTFNYWKGEYFNNRDLSGSPTLMRDDFSLYFDWGPNSPDPALGADNFSVRWTRTLNFSAGTYRFHLLHDDGARLYMDDVLQVNRWADCCDWYVSPDMSVSGGNHSVRYEMFENSGAAHAALYWERMDISGWRGEYYNNETLSGSPVLVRGDPNLDFSWQGNSPDPLVAPEHFSARWTRNLTVSAGDYHFDIYHDDGARVYIDNQLVFENWCDNCVLTEGFNRSLTAGAHAVKVEYREVGGYAGIRLTWQAVVAPLANDDFNSPTLVANLPFSASENTDGATTAGDDPNTCGSSQNPKNSHSVWFRFSPTIATPMTIDTLGSSYDTVLAVWTGTRGNLTSVVCNDDFTGTTSQVAFDAQAGVTYYIEVMAYSSGNGGNLTIAMRGATNSRRSLDDLDADGKSDLVWANRSTGQSIGWLMDGGTLRSWSMLPSVSSLAWQIVALGDLDGNGTTDLVWRNTSSGENIVWFMNGAAVASYAWLPTVNQIGWYLVAAADLDGDGRADLVWRNFSNGQNVAWLMDGASVSAYQWLPSVTDQNWRVAVSGDLDGDSKADLVWRNPTNGQNVVWLMDGSVVTTYAWLPTVPNQEWTLAGLGDLDNNTKLDIIWRHKTTGQNVAWFMNGVQVAAYGWLTTVPDQAWRIVAVDDLDGNRKADLVWRNGTTGQNIVWLMDGASTTAYTWLSTVSDPAWLILSPTYLTGWAGPQSAAKAPAVGMGGAVTSPAEPDTRKQDAAPFWTAPASSEASAMGTVVAGDGTPMWTASAPGQPFWSNQEPTAAPPMSLPMEKRGGAPRQPVEKREGTTKQSVEKRPTDSVPTPTRQEPEK